MFSLQIAKINGDVEELRIGSNEVVATLHHRVRKLCGIAESFDIIHSEKGCIFGRQQNYGHVEFAAIESATLSSLGVADGDLLQVIVNPPSHDSDGNSIPDLITDSDSSSVPLLPM